MRKLIYLCIAACAFASCKPRLSISTPTAGTADLTRYLAVGNSLTSGYADGSLYRTGQMNSYPNMLWHQFSSVGIAPNYPFKQPLVPGNAGFPSPKFVLAVITGCDGLTSLTPVPFSGASDTAGSDMNISSQGPFNNFGIPGIRAVDYLVQGYAAIAAANGAPFASRMFVNPAGSRPLDELITTVNEIKPTFFTMWLGNNDVLGYATAGGVGNDNGSPIFENLYSPDDISPDSAFKHSYDSTLNVLTVYGAKGVLINIPDITTIPFFTTVPANGLTLRQGQADSLNSAYLLKGTYTNFVKGTNYFMVQTHDNSVRAAIPGELILLTALDSINCAGWGSIKPIPNAYVLTSDEITPIETKISDFNSIIQQEASTHKIPFVNMNTYLKTVASGFAYNGVNYNAQFIQGGAFSLDGIHLTPRGYALVANQVILTINYFYSASVPLIDVNSYGGIIFP